MSMPLAAAHSGDVSSMLRLRLDATLKNARPKAPQSRSSSPYMAQICSALSPIIAATNLYVSDSARLNPSSAPRTTRTSITMSVTRRPCRALLHLRHLVPSR